MRRLRRIDPLPPSSLSSFPAVGSAPFPGDRDRGSGRGRDREDTSKVEASLIRPQCRLLLLSPLQNGNHAEEHGPRRLCACGHICICIPINADFVFTPLLPIAGRRGLRKCPAGPAYIYETRRYRYFLYAQTVTSPYLRVSCRVFDLFVCEEFILPVCHLLVLQQPLAEEDSHLPGCT